MNRVTQFDAHPDAEVLSGFAEHALGANERAEVVRHLAGCGRCREVVFLARAAVIEPVAAAPRKVERVEDGERTWIFRGRWAWAGALAMALLAVGTTWVTIHHREQAEQMARSEPRETAPAESIVAEPKAAEKKPEAPVENKQPLLSVPLPAQPQVAPEAKPSAVTGAEAVRRDKPAAQTREEIAKEELPAVSNRSFAALQALPLGVTAEAGAEAKTQNQQQRAAARPALSATSLPGPNAQQQMTMQQNSAAQGQAGRGGTDQGGSAGGNAAAGGTLDANAMSRANTANGANVAAEANAPVTANANVVNETNANVVTQANVTAEAPPAPVPAKPASIAPPGAFAAQGGPTGVPLLPGGLPLVSTVAAGQTSVAVDALGSLFVSSDIGKTWQRVKVQWRGRATKVRLAQPEKNEFLTDALKKDKDEAAKASAGAKESAAAVFEMVNDKNQAWTSADGKTWKAK